MTAKRPFWVRVKGFVGRRLDEMDRLDSEMLAQSLRASRDAAKTEARKWREDYNRLVRDRVNCFPEPPMQTVVQVRIATENVRDWRDREKILEHALHELKRQARW